LEGTTAFATKSSYHPDLKFPQNKPPNKNTQKKVKKKQQKTPTPPKHKNTRAMISYFGGRYFPSLQGSLA
jgi:hypothetical protein